MAILDYMTMTKPQSCLSHSCGVVIGVDRQQLILVSFGYHATEATGCGTGATNISLEPAFSTGRLGTVEEECGLAGFLTMNRLSWRLLHDRP